MYLSSVTVTILVKLRAKLVAMQIFKGENEQMGLHGSLSTWSLKKPDCHRTFFQAKC